MIQSVDRAIRILQALSDHRQLGVSELAARLGLAKGTVHGLLRTLADRALVDQDAGSGKYTLGPALLVMGNVYLNSHELRVRSLRWAESLASSTGWSVRVGVLAWPDIVIVHHVPAADAPIPLAELGIGIPAHASGLGKAVLSFTPDVAGTIGPDPLPRLTGRTVFDPRDLLTQLDSIRETGIAFASHEAVIGEAEVAGAVFDATGSVVGAVSIVVPTHPDEEPPSEASRTVAATARSISRELGADAWPVRLV